MQMDNEIPVYGTSKGYENRSKNRVVQEIGCLTEGNDFWFEFWEVPKLKRLKVPLHVEIKLMCNSIK